MFNIYLTVLLTFISTSLFAASFNCDVSKELTHIEKMICSDQQLNKADENMSQGFFVLLKKLSDIHTKKMFIEDQRNWLTKRNKELSTCSVSNCEIQFYKLRTQLLYPIADIACDVSELEIDSEEQVKQTEKTEQNKENIVKDKKDCFDKPVLKSPSEIICANRLLRHAEGKVLELYTPLKNELIKDQTEWLKLRDEKLKSCDLVCIWRFYKERIEFLVRYNFDEYEELEK
ncbi:hypothetical protein QUF74_07655 [Candidatus Halobeggiatoa sp. HSG11]|nr:hypothetical protein [Candidatus Halobeggiatoa sp. HSG11]